MRIAAFSVVLALVVSGCSAPTATPPLSERAGCVSGYEPGTDLFPVKSEVRHAKNFSLGYEKSYQVLTVNQPFPGGAAQRYVLVRCGTPTPGLTGDLAGATVIQTPVRSLFADSTTHIPLLADLERLDVLAGVANASHVVNPGARHLIDTGRVAEYAPTSTIDVERVLTAGPDVLMTGGTDSPEYRTLREGGVPVLANAEWLEPTPLARAEWLKVMAALTGEENRAGEVFTAVERDYQALAGQAAAAPRTPVLAGVLREGVWYAPAGGSYLGTLLRDAGTTNPWEHTTETGSLRLSLEEVIAAAGSARVWLTDAAWRDRADVTAADPRYASLTVDSVWTTDRAIGPGGGNDYFERGVTRPDLVLSDLVSITHPDLRPGHEATFYRQVGP